jgi:hypothetical protein
MRGQVVTDVATDTPATGGRSLPVRLRRAFINLAVAAVSVAITYLIAEVVFFRIALDHLSLNHRPYLPELADVLFQRSKAARWPKDYVAILGDSYAEGVGDWLLQAGGDRSKPFHSADVIHELTGRDVVSFGRSGSGSVQAMVRRVSRLLDAPDCWLFDQRLGPPRHFVVYFYEGNDIIDNAQAIGWSDDGAAPQPASTERVVAEQARQGFSRCHLYLGDIVLRMGRAAWKRQIFDKAFFDLPRSSAVFSGGKVHEIPVVDTPPVQIPADTVAAGVHVFDRSLAWLRGRFPEVPVTVVYLGATASLYRFPDGRPMSHGGPVAEERVRAMSAELCSSIRSATLAHRAAFLDTRAAFREETAHRLLHGPKDWYHFNEQGYRLLGQLVAGALDTAPKGECIEEE